MHRLFWQGKLIYGRPVNPALTFFCCESCKSFHLYYLFLLWLHKSETPPHFFLFQALLWTLSPAVTFHSTTLNGKIFLPRRNILSFLARSLSYCPDCHDCPNPDPGLAWDHEILTDRLAIQMLRQRPLSSSHEEFCPQLQHQFL